MHGFVSNPGCVPYIPHPIQSRRRLLLISGIPRCTGVQTLVSGIPRCTGVQTLVSGIPRCTGVQTLVSGIPRGTASMSLTTI